MASALGIFFICFKMNPISAKEMEAFLNKRIVILLSQFFCSHTAFFHQLCLFLNELCGVFEYLECFMIGG